MLLDLRGARTADIVVGTSPIAELQACLHVIAEPDHHPDDTAWLQLVSESIDDRLRERLMWFAPMWARRRSRFLLPLRASLNKGIADEVNAVAHMPVPAFVELAADTISGSGLDNAQLYESAQKQAAFVAACDGRSFSRGELIRALFADPEEFRHQLLATVADAVEQFFASEWKRIEGRLRQDADEIRGKLALPVAEFYSSLSPTATTVLSGDAVRFDKLQNLRVPAAGVRCLVVPTVHGRPHLLIRADAHWPIVIQYPSAALHSPVKSPSIAVVRERMSVLSDPVRLDLCRHLVNEGITTSELARRTTMARPQVSRHLAKLRGVGLLVSERSGRYVYHRLSVDQLRQLGPELLKAIIR
ncbi:MAG: transcription regulator ArsR [Mycobacterium sp.]|nr:transcription regulator ArsR [Mycobacterium sp.]